MVLRFNSNGGAMKMERAYLGYDYFLSSIIFLFTNKKGGNGKCLQLTL